MTSAQPLDLAAIGWQETTHVTYGQFVTTPLGLLWCTETPLSLYPNQHWRNGRVGLGESVLGWRGWS